MTYDCMLPGHLKPVKGGSDYYLAICPKCNEKNQLFWYIGNLYVTCNRRDKCGYNEKIWNIPGADKAKALRDQYLESQNYLSTPVEIPAVDISKNIKPCLNKPTYDTVTFIKRRIPGIDPYELIKNNVVGATDKIRNIEVKWLVNMEYGAFTPLYNIRTDEIVSGQARFTGNGLAPKDRKVMSLKGLKYGPGGATFGSLKQALIVAEKEAKKRKKETLPSIIIAEGDIDSWTLKACGYYNSVGVPGVGQAKNIVKHLKDIGWKGFVLLSLDGDKAGEESYKRVCKVIEGDDNPNLVICNARPINGLDLNDVYNKWGKKTAIRMLLNQARPLNIKKRTYGDLAKDKHFVRLMGLGLWQKTINMPFITKDRLRLEIRGTGGKLSPLKSFARAVNCKEVKEAEIFYPVDSPDPTRVAYRSRVAECPSCSHCLSVQWNLSICPHMLEHWPKRLRYIIVPFEEGNLDDAKKKKEEIFEITRLRREEKAKYEEDCGQSLFVITNVLESHLVVLTGAENRNDVVLTNLRYLGVIDEIDLVTAIKDYILPAHMSYSLYVNQAGEDFTHNLATDRILTGKFKRYSNRSLLAWPKQEEIRNQVRLYIKNKFATEEVKDRGEGYSLFFTFRERHGSFKKILGVSWKSISFANITNADIFGLPMAFDPRDPQAGNFLEDPSKAPKPIDSIINDFFWIQYGHPASALGLPYQMPKIKAKKAKERKFSTAIEMYTAWNEEGYDPRKYSFGPGEISLEEFIKIKNGDTPIPS